MLPLLFAAASLSLLQAAEYRYLHLDVFTDRTLSGNQLAVFLEPEGLSPELMMDLTREMAFSETTFVFPAEVEGTDFRVRIFGNNTGGELLVAGHPTIGTAFALAETGQIAPGTERVVFGLGIGPTPLELEWNDGRLEFAWMQQRLPEFSPVVDDVDEVAAALGVDPSDVRETGLPVQQVSCGAPFLIVPMSSRAAVDRAALDRQAMGKLLDATGLVRRGVMVYTSEPGGDGATVYSRMFGFGVTEDPATGNASGPLGAYLLHHGVVSPEQARHIRSRQGVHMGRPSWVHIRVLSEHGEITDVAVGGQSVLVGEGTVRVVAGSEANPERAASAPPVTISASEVHVLESVNVGDELRISVALPFAYEGSTASYPVVYALDANAWFGTYADVARIGALVGELPEAIVVGMGYPTRSPGEVMALRGRDYTPTPSAEMDARIREAAPELPASVATGGAGAFLRFLLDEVRPFLRERYRVDDSRRVLFGHSFGGLFALHVLFEEPDAFTDYVVGSPSLWYGDEGIFSREEAYAAGHEDLVARVFLSVGALEERREMASNLVELSRRLESRRYPGLRLETVVFDSETHNGVIPPTYSRGLRSVFEEQTNAAGAGTISEFLDSFVRSFNDLDWEPFRAHFSDDATVFFPGGYRAARAEGRDEVEAAFRGVFERWRTESSGPPYLDIQPLDLRIQDHGDVAVVTFHLQEAEGLNRRTLVLSKDEEAGWRIVHLHASSR